MSEWPGAGRAQTQPLEEIDRHYWLKLNETRGRTALIRVELRGP